MGDRRSEKLKTKQQKLKYGKKKNMKTTFYQLPIGAKFEFRGRRFEKKALSLASDEDRVGNVFQYETEVFWDCEPGAQPGPPMPPRPEWKTCPAPPPRREEEERWSRVAVAGVIGNKGGNKYGN